jgi:two-component system chemotaxis response regulator CheY
MRILLVDDSRTIRNVQKNVLVPAGYTDILEAADGIEAMSIIESNRPDLVLLDWNMPNMDGITVVRRVRETDKALPIIMVTTEAEKTRVVEAIKAGASNYVIKPFTGQTLLEKVQQVLAKAGPITAS